ncbi:MAG: glycosyltransferase family 9 protein [Bacteroidales bacterium]|nr:glycosyltransferase family 9 protein [Bacteroidales bacterium]
MAQNDSQAIGNDLGLKNVLVARFSALGDVAMTIPVLYSACKCYPGVRFIFVTRPAMTGIFLNKPDNLVVIGADVKKDYKGPKGLWRLAGELKEKYQIDAFVDLHDVLRTKLLLNFLRLKGVKTTKINKGRRHKHALTRRHNKVMLPLVSSRARYRQAFFKAGLPIESNFQGLYGASGKGDPALFQDITQGPKPQGEKWVGIAPFAAHAGKVYPIDKMAEVARALVARGDCRVFIFGAGGWEKEQAEKLEAMDSRITSLAGKRYGFPAELALLSHLDAMVTMDSANMHLAALAGVRTVSIWGATHYYCGFRAWHQSDADMVQLPLSCRPCSVFGDKKCFRGDMLCMAAIRPEVITHKINEILDAPNG